MYGLVLSVFSFALVIAPCLVKLIDNRSDDEEEECDDDAPAASASL